MVIFFVLGLAVGGLLVVFALQNTDVIPVTFFAWQVSGSLALLLLSASLSGMVATLLLLLPASISNYYNYRRLDREVGRLEEELRKQTALTVFARNSPPTREVIEHIENGAVATKVEYVSQERE